MGDVVTWGSKIYTLGDPRCIRYLRGLPGASLSGTHAYPTMFALQDVYVVCRGGGCNCMLHAVVVLCVWVLRLRFNDSAPSTGVL